MWKKINKWTWPFLVLGVSVLSILLLYRIVWAQFVPPDSQPGDAVTVGLTMNPMVRDLDLYNWRIVDSVFSTTSTKAGLVDASTNIAGKAAIYGHVNNAASYAIRGRADSGGRAGFFEGDLCLGTSNPADCIDSWTDISASGGGDSFWQAGGNGRIIYATSTTGNAELDIQTGAHNYWALYHDNVSEDLRFWNNDPSTEKNVLTLQSNGLVGIGIPDTYNPTARLEVRNRGSEDILNLYDDTTLVLAVADGGNTTLTNGNFTATNGNVLITNGSLGIGATNPGYKLNVVASPPASGVRSTGGGIGLYGEGSFAGILGVSTGPGSSAGYFTGPVYMADGNSNISFSSTGISLNTIGSNITFNSNANVNFASHVTQSTGYYSMRRSSIPPTATDCDASTEQGRIYLNYANDRLYVCSGSPVPAWKYTLLIP